MPNPVSPIQTTFNGGIQSPLLKGHIDAPRRDSSYKDSKNLLALKQGPLVRRGGTRNVFETLQTVTDDTKLVSFLFNDEQAYILEVSPDFLRVYADGGIVTKSADDQTITGITAASPPVVTVADTSNYTNGNWVVISGLTEAVELNDRWFRAKNKTATTVELFEVDNTTAISAPAVAETSSTGLLQNTFFLAHPYDAADLFTSNGLFRPHLVQSNDVMFIAHPDFQVRVLSRTANDAWSIDKLLFDNGPYLPENTTDVTITMVNAGGNVWTFTASSAIFVATDSTGGAGTATEADRLISINTGTKDADDFTLDEAPKSQRWRWGRITAFTSTTVVTVTVDSDQKNFPTAVSTFNKDKWRLGAYSDTTGYPSVIDIHEGRLGVGANNNEPRRVDLSVINGFSPTDAEFTPYSQKKIVRPDDAIQSAIGGGNASPIQWISSLDRGLGVGTTNREGTIRSSNRGESLTPENVSYKSGTTIGSRSIQPLNVNDNLLFVQCAGRRLHELSQSFERNKLVAPDMTELAEHLTREKIKAIAYQQEPINTVWVVLEDGQLLGFTYERESDVLGWHRHVIAGIDAEVESVAVIPSTDLSRDELWLTVARTIDGVAMSEKTRHYIERMERWFEDDIDREDIYHMDGGLSYNSTEFIISAATKANPVVITTTAAHGRSNGDKVYIKEVVGMTEINCRTFIVANKTATTFEIQDSLTNDIDGTGFTAYTSGGTVQESVSVFRALDYLEGETLQVYVDGNTHPDLVVTNGAITLANSLTGANVSAGFKAPWTMETLNWESGSATGTAQGKKQRFHKVTARLSNTLGFQFGEDEDNLDEDPGLYGTEVNGKTPLFTGDLRMNWSGGYEVGATMFFKGDSPYPVQIQALMSQVKTSDTPKG